MPTTVLRAAVIIGSGSASFEMLRATSPNASRSWSRPAGCAPGSSRSAYGTCGAPWSAARGCPPRSAFDIGGPEVLTYLEMMQRYAAVAGLPRRLILPVPVLTPGLSSHWVGLVTPVPASIARPLTESLRHEVVCHEHDIVLYVPDSLPGRPIGFDEAVSLALQRVRDAQVTTRWSSASVPGAPSDPLPTDPDWAGGSLYTDQREQVVDAPPGALWRVIEGIGGENGDLSARLGAARPAGPAGGRRGPAARTARRRPAARGRLARLLRVEEDPAGPSAAAARRNATAGPRVAGDVRRARRRGPVLPLPATGPVPSASACSDTPTGGPSRPSHAVVFGGMARNIARAAEADIPSGARRAAVPSL